MPGSLLLHTFAGVTNPDLMVMITMLAAFSLLFVTIVTGFAYDLQRQTDIFTRHPRAPTESG